MTTLAHEIDRFLNEVILRSENQHEILIGSCTSEAPLTNTQEHILMLLSEASLTNTDLSKRLGVSQAAVTKAIKSLIQKNMLETFKDERDGRVSFYRLTEEGRPIAEEHQHHHHHTIEAYEKLSATYTADEQELIARFLKELIEEIG